MFPQGILMIVNGVGCPFGERPQRKLRRGGSLAYNLIPAIQTKRFPPLDRGVLDGWKKEDIRRQR
jgi:hypothetical protein